MNNSQNRRSGRFFSGDEKELNEIRKKQTFERFSKRWKSRKRAARVMYTVLFSAIVLIFILICLSLFFRVDRIEVVGSVKYTPEQILEHADVKEKMSIFTVTDSDFDRAVEHLPYIYDVKVTRKLPDTVIVTVTEDKPRYAVTLYGEHFVLSKELRVLEHVTENFDTVSEGLITLLLPEIDSAINGDVIEFSADVSRRYVTAYINALETSPLFSKATAFDLRDRFNLAMIASDKYIINLGNGDELNTKLTAVAGMLAHSAFADGIPATIDATDPSQCPVIKNPDLVIEFDD